MSYIYILTLFILLLIWVPWLLSHVVRPYFAKDDLDLWLAKNPHRPHIRKCQRIYEGLFKNINAKQISMAERSRLGIDSDSFVYGEIEFLSFAHCLEILQPKPGDVFYDLGCGAGKAVYSAALLYDFSKVCGIELLPGLYKLAISLQDKFRILVERYLGVGKKYKILFVNQDFLKYNIQEANVIYINATCFTGQLWVSIVDKVEQLRIGTKVMFVTKSIDSSRFKLLHEQKHLMSWGMATVRIYEKVA